MASTFHLVAASSMRLRTPSPHPISRTEDGVSVEMDNALHCCKKARVRHFIQKWCSSMISYHWSGKAISAAGERISTCVGGTCEDISSNCRSYSPDPPAMVCCAVVEVVQKPRIGTPYWQRREAALKPVRNRQETTFGFDGRSIPDHRSQLPGRRQPSLFSRRRL